MGNATTIAFLMRRLHLDEPSIPDRVLVGSAVLSGVQAARGQLKEWGIEDATVNADLDAVATRTQEELAALALDAEEEHRLER